MLLRYRGYRKKVDLKHLEVVGTKKSGGQPKKNGAEGSAEEFMKTQANLRLNLKGNKHLQGPGLLLHQTLPHLDFNRLSDRGKLSFPEKSNFNLDCLDSFQRYHTRDVLIAA